MWNSCYTVRMDLHELSPDELKRLAPLAETTYGTLRQVAAGRRKMSSAMAINVEKASRRLGWDIRREDLNTGCAKCEFARACRKVATLKDAMK